MAPARLGGLLALLGLLLPATILAARSLPTLASLPLGQSLPLSTTFLLFVLLLAPVGLVSGYFFPGAVQVLAADSPQRAAGRAYYLETLGAAGGVLLLQLFLVGRYANLRLGLAIGSVAWRPGSWPVPGLWRPGWRWALISWCWSRPSWPPHGWR
jgi:hypothetical protein